MRRYLYLVLIALLVFTLPAFAGEQLTLTGFNVDGTGQINFRRDIEIVSTSDTLTVAESGKLFILRGTVNTMLTLPAASNAGIEYTFTSGASTQAQLDQVVTIDSVSTDSFMYLTTMAAGDSLKNPSSQASGDSVTITADGVTSWIVSSMVGTWQDGN